MVMMAGMNLVNNHSHGSLETYCWSMDPSDRKRVGKNSWLDYLTGQNPAYPEEQLSLSLATIRQKVATMREDPTTPDSRLSDDPMRYNPATVRPLVQLMLGGMGQVVLASHCTVECAISTLSTGDPAYHAMSLLWSVA